jgi:two-component system nitrogen regulation sensor histidine kinase NtrY
MNQGGAECLMDNNLCQEEKEARRRRRELLIIGVTLVAIVLLSLLGGWLSREGAQLPLAGSVLVFGMININIMLIILVLFLILRNVIKLFYDHRRGILGSRFRTRIVLAFVGFSLVPTAILFAFAIGFLSYSVDNWFRVKIGDSLATALEVTRGHYEDTSGQAANFARQIAADITRTRLYDPERSEYLRTLVEQRQRLYGFSHLEVHVDNPRRGIFIRNPDFPGVTPVTISAQANAELFAGREVKTVQETPGGDMLVAMVPVFASPGRERVVGVLTASYFVPRETTQKINIVAQAAGEYQQLHLLKNPIKLSFIITLSIVALLIIFSATWFGLFLAKGITGTIEYLAEATRRIAHGDLDYQIQIQARDEIGVLVSSFNQMTRELKKTKESLETAYNDLEGRKKYTETVLQNVSAGVVSLDREGRIVTVNSAAARMFDIEAPEIIGRRYEEILAPEHLEIGRKILGEISARGFFSASRHVQLIQKGRILAFHMAITSVRDDHGEGLGWVVVFDDVSKIQKEERAAAWREVARRMAHEIKNPLTPVQLSAQRLQRRYGEQMGAGDTIFRECTDTIIRQVEVLKNLVNEFTRYARLPETRPALNDLNQAIREACRLFQEAHREIEFHFYEDAALPLINIDPEQIKRAIVNLLDNAIASLDSPPGRIEITTFHDVDNHKVRVDVADNGRGISPTDKLKMFEPYFSTKKTGMGLGLTIVSSIISDHFGHVSVRDNLPKGTVVSFEIPTMAGTRGTEVPGA